MSEISGANFIDSARAIALEKSLILKDGLNPISFADNCGHTINIVAKGGKATGYAWTDKSGRVIPSFTTQFPGPHKGVAVPAAGDYGTNRHCHHCHYHEDGEIHCWTIVCPD